MMMTRRLRCYEEASDIRDFQLLLELIRFSILNKRLAREAPAIFKLIETDTVKCHHIFDKALTPIYIVTITTFWYLIIFFFKITFTKMHNSLEILYVNRESKRGGGESGQISTPIGLSSFNQLYSSKGLIFSNKM